MTVTTKTIAEALQITPRAVLIRADNEGWAHETRGRCKTFALTALPAEVSLRLNSERSESSQNKPSDAAVFALVRDKDRSLAIGRAALISAYQSSGMRVGDFLAAYHQGLVEGPWQQFGLKQVSEKTFYAWLLAFKREGGKALVPKWSLKASAEGPGTKIPEAAKDFLRSLYLSQAELSTHQCHLDMVRRFGPVCHPATTARYLSSLDQGAVKFHRKGPTAHRDTISPYVDRQPQNYFPMEQVQSDHHHWDFFINYEGELVRPWVTANIDYFSGKVLAAIPSICPNSATIAMAFAQMTMTYGAPEVMHTDNGKDYLAKALTGIKAMSSPEEEQESWIATQGLYQLCGTKLILATPYNGRSKGRTERFFGSAARYFARRFPTYCGSNTKERPEDSRRLHRGINKLPQIRVDGLDWGLYVQALDEFITSWNAEWVGEAKGRSGMTADQAFASKPSRAHQVDPALIEMSFGTAHLRTVVGCYVTIDGVRFYSRDLGALSGKKVAVRRLYHDPATVVITDQSGRLITRAASGLFTETDDLSAVMERTGIERKALVRAARALKPDLPPADPVWMPMAVGADHAPQVAKAKKTALPVPSTKLISPLDVGFAKEN